MDVDQFGDIAAQFDVSAMPTFKVIEDGNIVDELVGASEEDLEDLVARHL